MNEIILIIEEKEKNKDEIIKELEKENKELIIKYSEEIKKLQKEIEYLKSSNEKK